MRFLLTIVACCCIAAAASAQPSSAAAPQAAAAVPGNTPPPQARDISLLIARPTDVSVEGTKSSWMGALNEAYFHFRLEALSPLRVVPRDTMMRWIGGSRLAPDAAFLDAARKKKITYVLLQRYEVTATATVIYLSELYRVADNKTVVSAEREFLLPGLSTELDTWLSTIVKTLGLTPSETVARFYRVPALGGTDKDQAALGQLIYADWYEKGAAADLATKYARTAERTRGMHLASWLGALRAAQAGKAADVAPSLDNMLLTLGPVYPSLYAIACEGYRQAKRYDDALRMALLAEKAGITSEDILVQKGLALQAKNDRPKARETFARVLTLDRNQPLALLFMAEQGLIDKTPDRTVEYADRVLATNPSSGPALLLKGRAQVMVGSNDEALKNLSASTKFLKNDPAPYALMGDIYAKKRDLGRAAENYQVAMAGMPDDLDIRLKAVRCLRENGKKKEALDILKKSEAALSRNPGLYREMGLLEYDQGDSTNALTHLEIFAKSGQKDGDVLSALGALYLRANRVDQAQAALTEALPMIAEKNPSRMSLARIHLTKKNYKEAVTLLGQIAAEKPAYPDVNRLLGDGWLALGDKARAVSYYTRARTERAGDKDLQATIARLTDETAGSQAALAEYQALVKLDPANAQAYFRMAALALKLKAMADAERYVKMGSALAKPDPELYFTFAKAYSSQNLTSKAVEACRQVLDAAPKHIGALEMLAGLYESTKNDTAAADICGRLYQTDTQKYSEYLPRAVRHLMKAGKKRDALTLLRKNEAAFPKTPQLYREAGMLEYGFGDSTAALNHLELFVKSGSKDGEVMSALGILYLNAARPDQAQAALTEALPLVAEKNPTRFALAKIHLSKKNYTQAIALLEQIAAVQPAYPQLNRLLGDASLAAGDKARALTYYTRERTSRPADVALQTTIAQLAYERGASQTALTEYQALVKLDPSNAQAYFRLAQLSVRLKALADAERYVKMGSAMAKPDPELYGTIAQAYLANQNEAKAIEVYRQCLGVSPQNAVALQRLAELYGKQGNDSLAGDMCLKFYQIDSEKNKAYLVRAAEHFENAHIDGRAREAYTEFIDKKKFSDPQISLRAARLEYRLKNCARVLTLLDGVSGAAASGLDVLMMRLECAFATNRYADALATASRITGIDNKKARAFEVGALSADKLSDMQKATTMYEGYLGLLPSSENAPGYAFHVGEMYEKRNMAQAAATRYARNISLYPKESRNYERLTTLHLAAKRNAEALDVIKKALAVPGVASPTFQKLAAQTLLRSGNSQQAVPYLQEYLKSVPDDSSALYELGMVFYNKKNFPKAVEELSKASALMPRNFDCHYALGSAQFQTGSADKAAQAFERARSIRDKDTLPLVALAACYRSLKQEDDLARTLKRWLELRPNDPDLSRELGLLLLKKNKTVEALPLLESVSRSRPNDLELHVSLADIYKQQSNDALRLLHLEAALKLDPRRVAVNWELGRYYADKKSPAKAADYLRAAAGLEPKNAVIRFELGSALQVLNRNDEALDQYRAAVTADPRNLEYMLRVIELAYRLGQKKEATASVKLALEFDGAAANAKLQYWAGVLLMESGSPDSAKRYLQKAAAADRSCSVCFQYLGDIALSEGSTEEAVRQYTKALDASSGNEVVLVKLGRALMKSKKFDEAERIFERTVGQNSRNDEARYGLCAIYLRSDRVEAARQVFNSRPKGGQSGWYHLLTARMAELDGNTRQALIAYASAARALPDNVEAQNGCGRMYVLQNDFENGLMYLGKAAAIDAEDTQVMVDMARAYEGLGNPSAAQDFYQEVLRRDPSNEDAYYGSAHAYSKDNHLKAIETLKKGLEKNRNSARLALALAHEYRISNQVNDAIAAYQQAERLGGAEGREANRFLGDIYFLVLKDRALAKQYYLKYAKAGGRDQATLKRLNGL